MCNYTLKVFNMNDEGFEIDFSELHDLLDAFDSEETGKYYCELVKKYSEKYTPYDTVQLFLQLLSPIPYRMPKGCMRDGLNYIKTNTPVQQVIGWSMDLW